MEGSAFFLGISTTYRGWFQMSELDFVYRYSVCVIGLLKLLAKRVDLAKLTSLRSQNDMTNLDTVSHRTRTQP